MLKNLEQRKKKPKYLEHGTNCQGSDTGLVWLITFDKCNPIMICKVWLCIICRNAILIITIYNFHYLHTNKRYFMSNTIWLWKTNSQKPYGYGYSSTFSDADNAARPIGMKTMPRKINTVTTWMQKMRNVLNKPLLQRFYKMVSVNAYPLWS